MPLVEAAPQPSAAAAAVICLPQPFALRELDLASRAALPVEVDKHLRGGRT